MSCPPSRYWGSLCPLTFVKGEASTPRAARKARVNPVSLLQLYTGLLSQHRDLLQAGGEWLRMGKMNISPGLVPGTPPRGDAQTPLRAPCAGLVAGMRTWVTPTPAGAEGTRFVSYIQNDLVLIGQISTGLFPAAPAGPTCPQDRASHRGSLRPQPRHPQAGSLVATLGGLPAGGTRAEGALPEPAAS